MKRTVALLAALLIGAPARAAEADLCRGLKAAWTAAKTDPKSARTLTLAGAKRCSFSDDDLRCFWVLDSPEAARRKYDELRAVAVSCLAPLGLSPRHKVLDGVETTSLEPRDDREPNVDVFYPPGGSIVDISIVTAD